MQQCLVSMMVGSVLPYIIMVAYKYQASVTLCDDSETADWEEYGGHLGGAPASLFALPGATMRHPENSVEISDYK